MIYRALADAVVVLHLGFVVFVALGGFLALRWPRVAWAHLPAALWGAAIEIAGWGCPLTPLEKSLRAAGGEAAYGGGFIAHYLEPLIYPAGLTRRHQLALAAALVALNLAVYGLALTRVWPRHRRG